MERSGQAEGNTESLDLSEEEKWGMGQNTNALGVDG